jgi:hypothetical protein
MQRGLPPNKSLQLTFDQLLIFASAENAIASNAAELKRGAQDQYEIGRRRD